jgi:hypothetical protein
MGSKYSTREGILTGIEAESSNPIPLFKEEASKVQVDSRDYVEMKE